MRHWAVLAVWAVTACYEAPTSPGPCQIQCSTGGSCPDGTTCRGGFCLAEGQVCRPAFRHVGAGRGFACGIDDLGALWCWGSNRRHEISDSTQVAYSLATRISTEVWDAVDGGGEHVCAIRGGQLYCWGANEHGQASPRIGDITTPTRLTFPGEPASWTAVSAGRDYTCAIGDGNLYCWGNGERSVLGTDTTTDAPPTQVTAVTTSWTAVATGTYHTCGISDGIAYCWGLGFAGALGPNGDPTSSPTPVVVPLPGPVVAIAVTVDATCAALADGALYCWGSNELGDLGEAQQAITMTATPGLATPTGGWSQLAASESAVCGLHAGALECWGTGNVGGLGGGLWDDSKQTRKVATGVTEVALGWNEDVDPVTMTDHVDLDLACGVFGTEIRCWGDDRDGQLGNGGTTQTQTPVELAGSAFTELSIGSEHACGIAGGALSCWGSTVKGQATGVATGVTAAPCTPQLDCDVGAPKAVSVTPHVDQVVAGVDHTCQLEAGTLYCWGADDRDQLGAGGVGPRPHLVPGPTGLAWTRLIPTGGQSQCAILGTAGQAYCWGDNPFTGALSLPIRAASLDSARQLVTGKNFHCVLDAAGKLQCAGDNSKGQLGDPSHVYAAIASNAGAEHACGIRQADQTIECWGANDRGQTGDTTMTSATPFVLAGLSSCTAVSVAARHSCAICSGQVACWGDNTRGGLGAGPLTADKVPDPRTLDLPAGESWVELGSGDDMSCVRSETGRVFCWGQAVHGGLGIGGIPANLPSTVLASPIR